MPILQCRLAPIVEGEIVDQIHMALGTHDIAQQFAVIAVAREHIGDLHSRLDAREAQHLRRMIQRVARRIGRGTARVRQRRVIVIRAMRMRRRQTATLRTAHARVSMRFVLNHLFSPLMNISAMSVMSPAVDK